MKINKKIKKIFFHSLWITTLVGIIVVSHTSLISNHNISNNVLNSKQEVATDATIINDLNIVDEDATTSVHVIKNGYDSLTASSFIQELTNNNRMDFLNTFFQIVYYELVVDPLTQKYFPITNNQPQFQITNTTPDDYNGILNLTIHMDQTYEAGAPSGPKDFVIQISGFKRISKITSVSVNNNFPFSQTQKSDLIASNDLLRQTIVIDNLPDNATFTVEIVPDSLQNEGSLDVIVTVSSYFDEDYNLIEQEKQFPLTLNGLSNNPNTLITAKQDVNKSIIPSRIAPDDLLNYVQINAIPQDAQVSINYNQELNYNNKQGTIDFQVELSKYYLNGVEIDRSKIIPIHLDGFISISEYSQLKPNDNLDFLPSNVNVDNLKSFLDYSTFPEDVVFSNGEFVADNINGTLTIRNLIASSGYENDERFSEVQNYQVPEITITGLNIQSLSTSVIPINNDNTDILATSISPTDILTNYLVIEDLPPNVIPNIENLVADNLTGRITFDITIPKYYDEYGVLRDNFVQNFTISNFKIVVQSSLEMNGDIDVSQMLASDLTIGNVDDFIVGFDTFPANTVFSKYQLTNVNNLIGEIDVSVTANKWFDELGNQQPNNNSEQQEKTFIIHMDGFKTTQQTTAVKTNVNNSNTLASSIDSQAMAEQLFTIENQSQDPKYPTKVTATSFTSNNIAGTLSFILVIDNYFDDNGIFRCSDDYDYKSLIVELSFNDFKKVLPSRLFQKTEPSTILPTEMNETLILNYLDYSTFPEDVQFIESSWEFSNQKNIYGTFDVSVTVDKWYDNEGNLINTPNRFSTNFVGAKTQQPTAVVQSNYDVSNKVASEIDSYEELINLIEIVNPLSTTGQIVPGVDWTASNFAYFNQEGRMTVEIKIFNYYNSLGNGVQQGDANYEPFVQTITLTGFKMAQRSELLPNTDIDTSNILPSEITLDRWQDYVDFSLFPDNKIIDQKSVRLYPVDKNGELTIVVGIRNYYNANGVIEPDQQLFNVTLTGFMTQTVVTTVEPINNNDPNCSVTDAVLLANNNEQQFLDKYVEISGLPDGPNDISISSIFPNNIDGTITISIAIENYYDENGNISRGFLKTIVIKNFARQEPTTITQNYACDFSQITAEDFTNEFNNLSTDTEKENRFKEIITWNSLPDDANFLGFVLSPINVRGELNVSFIVSQVYDNEGKIKEDQHFNITFSGFKKINPSTLEELQFSKTFPPSDLNITKDNFWDFFNKNNFPSDVQINSLLTVPNNNNGTISVQLTVSKFYGVDGNVNNGVTTYEYELQGFETINSPSRLEEKSDTAQYKNSLPTNLIEAYTNDALFNMLVNTSSFPQENIELNVAATTFTIIRVVPNDVDGSLTFNVIADKSYGTNGKFINSPQSFEITIGGFKTTLPSSISIDTNLLPSKVSYDDLEFKNFINIPNKQDVIFNNINDQTGTISVVIENANFYDSNGVLRQNTTYHQSFILSTFKQKKDISFELGLGLGLGIPLVVLLVGVVGWHFYKKTHEV